MAVDISVIAAEIVSPNVHPTTLVQYSTLTDEQCRDALNAENRPDDTVSIGDILDFLQIENVHSTDGSDTQDRAIWERMEDVEALGTTPTGAVANPWGSTVLGNITEIQQVKTQSLLAYFRSRSGGNLPVDLADTEFQSFVAGAQAAGCMSTTQETALLALGDNKRSRAAELEQPVVKTKDVTEARLP